jgi:signal transduction histidine kinase
MTRTNKTKTILSCLLIVLIFFSCTENESNTDFSDSTVKKDSVIIWIKQSKVHGISTKSRITLLEKAMHATYTLKSDSLRGKPLSKLSLEYFNLGDSLTFRKVNSNARELAKKLKDSVSLQEARWDLATFFKKNAVMDSAYFYYSEAQKGFEALGKKENSGLMLLEMAIIQAEIGDYTGSEITSIKAIEKFKTLEDYQNLYRSYVNLGDVAKNLKEYETALEYFGKANDYLNKRTGTNIQQQILKNNIGLVYQEKGEFEKAIDYFTEVVAFDSLQYKSPRLYARTLNNLGYSMLKSGSLSNVPSLFTEALLLQDSIGDVAGQSSSHYKLGEYYLEIADSAAAFKNFKSAQTLAKQSNNNERYLQTLAVLPKVDPENASTYTLQYIALNDSLLNQERQLRDKFARIRFETDEVVAENELLARQRQLLTGIAVTLLLLSLSAFVIVSQRIKNQKLRFQQEQQASNQEIFNLMLVQSEKLEEGKKMAQKRISEELHDGVQGRLQGARMMLLGLNPRSDEKAVNERKRAIIMLKEVQDEVRAISHELSHAAYQKIHNFILSLEDLRKTVSTSANIEIDFKYAEQLDWDSLSGDIKINLYRVIQESIQNAVKHAQCNKIDLELEVDAKDIRVSITDDGKGFVVKKGRKGIGMRNIASRMKKIDGIWDITSEIDRGTNITLVIPIAEIHKSNLV